MSEYRKFIQEEIEIITQTQSKEKLQELFCEDVLFEVYKFLHDKLLSYSWQEADAAVKLFIKYHNLLPESSKLYAWNKQVEQKKWQRLAKIDEEDDKVAKINLPEIVYTPDGPTKTRYITDKRVEDSITAFEAIRLGLTDK